MFKQELISYFDKVVSTVPYNLKYNFDTDLSSLMKSISVEIDDDSDSLLEKMMQYINLMNQICGVNIFVIPNLKAYFSPSICGVCIASITIRYILLYIVNS